jgi:hypothetical protein
MYPNLSEENNKDKKEHQEKSLLDQNKKLRDDAHKNHQERFSHQRKIPDLSKGKTAYLVDHVQYSDKTINDNLSAAYYGLLGAIVTMHADIAGMHEESLKRFAVMDEKLGSLGVRVARIETKLAQE